MKLFGKKRKRSHSRRSIPLEEKQRRKADKYYIARIETDPKLADLYIEKFLGIEIPVPDPVKEGRTKLQVAVIDKAIQQISENPELAKRISVQKLEEIIGIKVDQGNEEGNDREGYSRSSIGQFLQRLDELEEIKERLGPRQGGGFFGMYGNTIAQIALAVLGKISGIEGVGNVGQLMGQFGNQPVSPVRTYVVEIDGQNKELNETQYQLLLQQGKIRPLVWGSHEGEEPSSQEPQPVAGGITLQVDQPGIDDAAPQSEHPLAAPAPKVEVSQGLPPDTSGEGSTKSPPDVPEEVKVTREPTPEERMMFLAVVGAISPSYIVYAMAKTPKDFVTDLYTDIEENKDTMSKKLLVFLKQVDMDSFLDLLLLFTNHPEYGTFITNIVSEEGREWLLSVVSIVGKADSAPG